MYVLYAEWNTQYADIVMYIANYLMSIVTLIRFKYISLKIIREKYNYIQFELIKHIIFVVWLE